MSSGPRNMSALRETWVPTILRLSAASVSFLIRAACAWAYDKTSSMKRLVAVMRSWNVE